MSSVGVVGAGVAGLSAAWALTRAGATVTVFEAGRGPGGRAHRLGATGFEHRGERWDFDLEHGVHGVWRQYRNLRRLVEDVSGPGRLRDVGGQELVLRTRRGIGHWDISSPVRASRLPSLLANLRLFSEPGFAAAAMEDRPWAWPRAGLAMAHALAFRAPHDFHHYEAQTVADFTRGWPGVARGMVAAISHSAFFRDPEEVGLAAFFTGLQGYFVAHKLDTAFACFRNDIHVDLLEPLCRCVTDAGGQVRFGAPVLGVELRDGVRVRSAGGEDSVDGLVLAVDPPAMSALAATSPRLDELLQPWARPQGIPSAVARFWFDRQPASGRPDTGVMYSMDADNYFWLDRLLGGAFARWSATGGSTLETHLYGHHADAAVAEDDEVVLDRVQRTVQEVWPELAGACVHRRLQRNPPTHVAFAPGVIGRLPPVRPGREPVALAGDWIACETPILYMERACITGLEAARSVASSLGLAADAIPPLLPPHPPGRSIDALHGPLSALRDRGLLLGGRSSP